LAAGDVPENDLLINAGRREDRSSIPGQGGQRAVVSRQDVRRAVGSADTHRHVLAPELDAAVLAAGREERAGVVDSHRQARSVKAADGLIQARQGGVDRRQGRRLGGLRLSPGRSEEERGQYDNGEGYGARHELPPRLAAISDSSVREPMN